MNRDNWVASVLIASLLAIAPMVCAAQEKIPPPPPEVDPCDPDEPDDSDCEPRIQIIGSGGGGGSSGAVSFNWNGPGRIDYGIYDHGCLDYADEFKRLVIANQGLIGSVTPQATNWDQALATMRARLDEPLMRAVYDAAMDPESKSELSLAIADPEKSLVQLLASVEKAPDHPTRLFNLAGALNRNGMPNEALAVLARIRELGKLPDPTLNVSPSAAMDYQEGYAEMLRGNLPAATTRFQSTIGQEPFLNAASHSLALIQAHQGNGAAQETYRAGMWRFKPKYLVVCGGTDVRPPVDDMYDTSIGKDGKLVEFWHPEIATELESFYAQAGALAQSRLDIAEPLKQRMIVISNNSRFAGTDDPYDAWASKLTQLIWGIDEQEPYLLQQKEKVDRAIRTAQYIAGYNQAFVLRRVIELATQPGNHCPTYRSLISQGIQGTRPHAERVEAEMREYARIYYKMETGLASNIGDPEWFEYNDVAFRAELESMNAGMLAMMMNYYAFPGDLVIECPEEFVEMFAPQIPPAPPPDPCEQVLGSMTIKHTVALPKGVPGPKFNVEVGCKEIKVDGGFDIVNASSPGGHLALNMGARTSMSFKKGQGFDMFLGVGADAKAFGHSGSVQAGAFVSGDANGLTNLGGRVKQNRVDGTKETMDFGLMAKPATASRGPQIRNFRTYP